MFVGNDGGIFRTNTPCRHQLQRLLLLGQHHLDQPEQRLRGHTVLLRRGLPRLRHLLRRCAGQRHRPRHQRGGSQRLDLPPGRRRRRGGREPAEHTGSLRRVHRKLPHQIHQRRRNLRQRQLRSQRLVPLHRPLRHGPQRSGHPLALRRPPLRTRTQPPTGRRPAPPSAAAARYRPSPSTRGTQTSWRQGRGRATWPPPARRCRRVPPQPGPGRGSSTATYRASPTPRTTRTRSTPPAPPSGSRTS